VLAVDEAHVAGVTTALEASGESVHRIGLIQSGDKGCTVRGSTETWSAQADWSATHLG
jgi:phosphoribosylformylglycinamidine cyclo-ligase